LLFLESLMLWSLRMVLTTMSHYWIVIQIWFRLNQLNHQKIPWNWQWQATNRSATLIWLLLGPIWSPHMLSRETIAVGISTSLIYECRIIVLMAELLHLLLFLMHRLPRSTNR
jgi:hypothetical protein